MFVQFFVIKSFKAQNHKNRVGHILHIVAELKKNVFKNQML